MSAQQQPATPPNPSRYSPRSRDTNVLLRSKQRWNLIWFTAIAKGSQTAAGDRQACNAAERGIRMLSDSLVVMGFLTKKDNNIR